MIEVENLTKRYGEKLAADGLDFVVGPGVVTGFLGPNGAGQPATMRMIAGPVRAEKSGHDAGPDDEVQPVDRQLLPVPLTKVLYLDHRVVPRSVTPVTPARHPR